MSPVATAETHPRVRPRSQFNDPTTTLDGSNCTSTGFVMLGDLATAGRTRLYPGQFRAMQADQDGGISIPDGARAWQKAYPDAELNYASSDDGTPIPPGKTGSTITAQGAWELLADGYGLVLQGLYIVIEAAGFSLQRGFREGHAMYIDGIRTFKGKRQAYVIDPLGRAGYRGQWMPWSVLVDYGLALGRGGLYAAWARPPLPDSSTGDAVQSFTFIEGRTTSGTLTVSEKGHSYQRLLDGSLHGPIVPGPAWTDRPALGPVRLLAPIKGGKPGADRSTVYITGDEAAALLASDVTFRPSAAADCSGAVAAEHERVRAAAIKKAEEL